MSDRLDEALREMAEEPVEAGALAGAQARVREKLIDGASSREGAAGCAEFRPDLPAYIGGALTGSRQLLVQDHLSRCTACRAAIADMKGERRVVPMPRRSASFWRRWAPLAAAAVLLMSVLYVSRDAIDTWMAPSGPRATIASTSGDVYLVPGGVLRTGAGIDEGQVVRTSAGAHAVLRLADGSLVDVNERTELFVTAAWSGQAIHLQRGDVIVQAAKQRRGHLRVLTRDSIASVKGTVFAVSAGLGGSVVSVVEGSVQVNQPGLERLLAPGEQAASNPSLATSVADAVSWSPEAEEYLQLLASFAKIGDRMTQVGSPLRTESALLSYLPAGAFVYGAVPNPGGNLNEGLLAAEEQAMENAAFRAWWTSETGAELRQIVDRARRVSGMLGDEVVFAATEAGGDEMPIVIARVQPDRRESLTADLDGLFAEAGESRPYAFSNDLLVLSDSAAHAAWAAAHLGEGAGTPFAAAIAERYQRGAGWLLAVDAASIVTMAAGDDAPPVELARLTGLKYLFFEQRTPSGAEENEVTAMFAGARSGIASWLADGGSGGAAEFIPADALVAGYVSMRQPGQLFQEFTALMAAQGISVQSELGEIEQELGSGFVANLTAAMGTEAAFAVQGLSVTGPTWVAISLVNDPAVVDASIRKLVDVCNANATSAGTGCTLEQETVNGQVWNTLRLTGLPVGVSWSHYGGYLIAASDRGTGDRAIAARNTGSALVWSSAFRAQLPASATLHPSAFAWMNPKGALGFLSTAAPNPAVAELLSARDPMLLVVDGKPDQVHLSSRTRLSGVVIDAMLLGSLSNSMPR
jgi:hypothetical protein